MARIHCNDTSKHAMPAPLKFRFRILPYLPLSREEGLAQLQALTAKITVPCNVALN